MVKQKNGREINEFQMRHLHIMSEVLLNRDLTETALDLLRENELEYFSLLSKYQLLEEKSNIDSKTNLLRFNDDYLTRIIKTASRIYDGTVARKYDVSFVRFDIDDFSVFNNKYGHDVGDLVLLAIADCLKKNSRPTDYLIRFGGEEFDVLLPSTDLTGTEKYLQKLYRKFKELHVQHRGKKLSFTLSAGVSTMGYDLQASNRVIKDTAVRKAFARLQQEADNALYEAKYKGKNTYCVYDTNKQNEYLKIRKLYVMENTRSVSTPKKKGKKKVKR